MVATYISTMTTLMIENIPDDVRDRLNARAALHGRSIEAEAREVLAAAVVETTVSSMLERAAELQRWVAENRQSGGSGGGGSGGVVDELIREKRREVILDVINDGLDPKDYFGSEFTRICEEASWTPAHIRKLRRTTRK